MSESARFLGGYVGVSPTRRADWMVREIPDPYLTISNCLADDLLVPQFYGWFQSPEEARAVIREAPEGTRLLAVGLERSDAEVLLEEYADEPHYFQLLRERNPLPADARVLGFDVLGIEYGLSFHSWLCHPYAEEVERELGVTLSPVGLLDSYADASAVLQWMLTRPAAEAPEPVPWTVVTLAEIPA